MRTSPICSRGRDLLLVPLVAVQLVSVVVADMRAITAGPATHL